MIPVFVSSADDCDCSRRPCEAGFTLVEVMVALTILSLIMLATVTALRTLANTQGAIERMTDRVDELRSVSTFLREILESVVVGSESGELTVGGAGVSGNTTFFRHGASFFEIKSTILFGEGYGGSYLLRVAQEGTELVLRWQESPVNGKPENWTDMPSRVMVGQLEEFTVATQRDYGSEWSDQWAKGNLPSLARFKIKAAGRYWPDLVMQMQR